MDILVVILIGAIAGWLAGQIMSGKGYGLIGNIAIGIIGAIVGSFLLGGFIGRGIFGSIVTATIGAIIVIFVVRKIR